MTRKHKRFIWPGFVLLGLSLSACTHAQADESQKSPDQDRRYRILVTNDDGIDSAGIRTLAVALAKFADVYVSAPEKNESGASQSSRLLRSRATATPVDMSAPIQAIAVNGTPADSTGFGIDYFGRDLPIDLVVSGVNDGGNYGDAYFYSGTIGAAFQALAQGVPAIAVSQDDGRDEFDVAARFTVDVVKSVLSEPLPDGVLLSINVPAGALAGVRVVPARGVTFDLVMEPAEDEQGSYYKPVFTVKDEFEAGYDIEAYGGGFIAVTPLELDRNAYEALDALKARSFVSQQP